MDLETEYQAPPGCPRDIDRAVLLAHGAGSDMDAATLRAVADALSDAGIPSLRFNFPYRTAGRKAPDRAPVLEAATREAAQALGERAGLPAERLVLGGRSMGGRYCSLVVGDVEDPQPALGLVLLGYPLHPAGKPERLRVEHFPRLTMPVLFVSGTRDALAPQASLVRHAGAMAGRVTFQWLETADHGFKPLKASGRSLDDTIGEAAAAVVRFVEHLDP